MQGSGAVTVTGTGSVASPYIISAAFNLAVLDSATVDMSLSGDGSIGSPWTLSAIANLDLNALTDVDTAGAATGQVLARNAGGTYSFVPATTAPTGAINLLSTGGLQGDGSAGLPLNIKLAPSSGLTLSASGLAVSGATAWTSYTPTLTATTTNPALGNGALIGYYSQQGKTVHVSIDMAIGSTTTRGVGAWMWALPVPPVASRWQVMSAYMWAPGVAEYAGVARIAGATRIERLQISTSTASQAVSHSTPASLPAGSRILMTGTYEAA